jgi:hypothetical protein
VKASHARMRCRGVLILLLAIVTVLLHVPAMLENLVPPIAATTSRAALATRAVVRVSTKPLATPSRKVTPDAIEPGSPAADPSPTPLCGQPNDKLIHPPPNWASFTPPSKGGSYVDPVFGCTITRLTDVSNEDPTGDSHFLSINHYYASLSPINANDSMLLLGDGWGWFVTDMNGNVVVSRASMPPGNLGTRLWDASDPSVFYYTSGQSLMKGTIGGFVVNTATVHQFSEYTVINFMDEADVSEDGMHVVIVGGDATGSSSEDVFDYNFVTNTKGPVYRTTCTGSVNGPNNSCLHKLVQTSDNNIIIQFAGDGSGAEQGNRLWNGTFPLPHVQDVTAHLDSGYDLVGNPIFITLNNSYTLAGVTNPCPSGWGLDVRSISNISASSCLLDNPSAWHVSYRGGPSQPWVVLSFFDWGRTQSPELFNTNSNYTAPTTSNWRLYEDEIVLARVDGNAVYRLAHARSRSMENFWATPRAAISRDGKYIVFDSNMAFPNSCPSNMQVVTACSDVYLVKVF